MKPHLYFRLGAWRARYSDHFSTYHALGRTPREAYHFLWTYLYVTKDAIPPPKPYRAAAKQ